MSLNKQRGRKGSKKGRNVQNYWGAEHHGIGLRKRMRAPEWTELMCFTDWSILSEAEILCEFLWWQSCNILLEEMSWWLSSRWGEVDQHDLSSFRGVFQSLDTGLVGPADSCCSFNRLKQHYSISKPGNGSGRNIFSSLCRTFFSAFVDVKF